MLFRRRSKLNIKDYMRAILFPKKGWKRAFPYIKHRLRRRPGDPRYIAMGVACGVGISFLPFLGVHLLSGYIMARVLRGDVFAMVVGTTIGNPWTFPLMFFSAYHLGNFIMGRVHVPIDGLPVEPIELSIKTITHDPMALLVPMTVGGVILGFLFAIVAYYLVFGMVHGYQMHRKKHLSDRRTALNKRLHELKQHDDEVS